MLFRDFGVISSFGLYIGVYRKGLCVCVYVCVCVCVCVCFWFFFFGLLVYMAQRTDTNKAPMVVTTTTRVR